MDHVPYPIRRSSLQKHVGGREGGGFIMRPRIYPSLGEGHREVTNMIMWAPSPLGPFIHSFIQQSKLRMEQGEGYYR